jgi:itaconyl-CoA hydratase
VAAARESAARPAHGIVSVRTRGINQRREVVCEFARSLLIAKRDAAASTFPGTDEPWQTLPAG